MKNIVATLLTLAISLTVSAQHLTFKGVAIDGDIATFVENLKQKGFTVPDRTIERAAVETLKDYGIDFTNMLNSIDSYDDGTATLEGNFAFYQDCTVKIAEAPNTNTVYTVRVNLYWSNHSSDLDAEYLRMKELLTEKYGSSTDTAFPKSATFTTSLGTITLAIDNHRLLTITYTDKQNSNISRAKALEDL